ncbi:MAG: single-stranded-DNA-specific exonuclease RecJ [Candidatus Paceibacterota bacterium]|jgi:single-stranded-DNA-specific exonuclease
MHKLFEEILKTRGLTGEARKAFLNPDYNTKNDPFLLPDMDKAVDRLARAYHDQEKITIYGDYDIDGLTATTLLIEALNSFGFTDVGAFIPSRFAEGYGLTKEAIKRITDDGTRLIITVDCGSLSEQEIIHANRLGVDVIVTDHHNVAPTQPPAIAVINPRRPHHRYPFIDLAGVGVAFKLVQALQTCLDGLLAGQEKWLLDLVALGTVCDVVPLIGENRTNVYWGLKVLSQTRRPGLKALMTIASVEPAKINTHHLGFTLGPRLNAAGRLETAKHALDILTTKDLTIAFKKAQKLDEFNKTRRFEQDAIFQDAVKQAEQYQTDPVLVVNASNWHHGVVGIVASRLLEKYKKPTYVLVEMGDETKGSARSYGDFSAVDAIRAAGNLITQGGGHTLAAGVTLPTKNIDAFRRKINEFYRSQNLSNQEELLLPVADATAQFCDVTEDLVEQLAMLEPFGKGNPQPILKSENLLVVNQQCMGSEAQHVKLDLQDSTCQIMPVLAFRAPQHFFAKPGERVTVWYHPTINEWNGRRTIEGQLLHLKQS